MNRLLTATQVAERLGGKPGWVWARARAGRIPHVELGLHEQVSVDEAQNGMGSFEEVRRREFVWFACRVRSSDCGPVA